MAKELPRIEPKCRMCSEAWVGLGMTGKPGTTATSLHDSGSFLVKHGFKGSGFYALVDKKVNYKPKEYSRKCGTAVPISFGLEGHRSNFKISPNGHPRCEFTSGQTFGKAEYLNRKCGCHRHLDDCKKIFPWDRAATSHPVDDPLHREAKQSTTKQIQKQATRPRKQKKSSRKDLQPRGTGCNQIKSRRTCCNSIDSRYESHGFLDSKNNSITHYFGGSICLPVRAGKTFSTVAASTCEPELMLQRQERMREVGTCGDRPSLVTPIAPVPPLQDDSTPVVNINRNWSSNASELSFRNSITDIHGATLSLGEKVQPTLRGCRVQEKSQALYDHLTIWPGAKRGSPRILCSVYTQGNKEKIPNQVGIWHTWGQTCDKFIFWTDEPLPARFKLPYQVVDHGTEAYNNMWSKVNRSSEGATE